MTSKLVLNADIPRSWPQYQSSVRPLMSNIKCVLPWGIDIIHCPIIKHRTKRDSFTFVILGHIHSISTSLLYFHFRLELDTPRIEGGLLQFSLGSMNMPGL